MDTESLKRNEVGAVGCGTQLVINFAPDLSDTEHLRLKCMNFWKVIEEDPEMKYWSAVPKKQPRVVPVTELRVRPENRKPTAVEMLDFVKEKGLYNLVYRSKKHVSCLECGEDTRSPDGAKNKNKLRKHRKISKTSTEAEHNVCKDLDNLDNLQNKIKTTN